MKRLILPAMLFFVLPVSAAGPDEYPAPTPAEAEIEEAEIVCAVANVSAGLATAFSVPMDYRRGSCWTYGGATATGKVRLYWISGERSADLGAPDGMAEYFRAHPFKIEEEIFDKAFVPESSFEKLRNAEIEVLRAKWVDLSQEKALLIFQGSVFLGMTMEQAHESVGWLVHRKYKKTTDAGEEETWDIGKRSLGSQIVGETKQYMMSDLLLGPMATWRMRTAPPSPTAAAASQETIRMILTFSGEKLVKIEDVSRAR